MFDFILVILVIMCQGGWSRVHEKFTHSLPSDLIQVSVVDGFFDLKFNFNIQLVLEDLQDLKYVF